MSSGGSDLVSSPPFLLVVQLKCLSFIYKIILFIKLAKGALFYCRRQYLIGHIICAGIWIMDSTWSTLIIGYLALNFTGDG